MRPADARLGPFRNVHPNPGYRTTGGGWGENPSEGFDKIERVVDDLPGNTGWALRIESTTGAAASHAVDISPAIPCTEGQMWTVSFDFLSGGGSAPGGTMQLQPRVRLDPGTYYLSGSTIRSSNSFDRYVQTFIVPAGRTSFTVRPLIVGGINPGGAARYRKAVIMEGAVVTDYFENVGYPRITPPPADFASPRGVRRLRGDYGLAA